MIKKVLMTSCLLIMSMASHAGLISHYGYERESGSNIVVGGGLEWLMWDVTAGMSASSALTIHAGWRLATSAEMVSLFNTFQFGKDDWVVDATPQLTSVQWNATEVSQHNQFMELFGVTSVGTLPLCYEITGSTCLLPEDPYHFVAAIFEHVAEGATRLTWVSDDYTVRLPSGDIFTNNHGANLLAEPYDFSLSREGYGVALVRQYALEPVQVNTPASLSLLALSLIALGFSRRQARYRLATQLT